MWSSWDSQWGRCWWEEASERDRWQEASEWQNSDWCDGGGQEWSCRGQQWEWTNNCDSWSEDSSLDVQAHSVDIEDRQWDVLAFDLFAFHGFVVVTGVLTAEQCSEVHGACQRAAAEIIRSGCKGNRGYGRYSFGVASRSGGMLHLPAFSRHLLDAGGSALDHLLHRIFSEGKQQGKSAYMCYSSGGDFVMGNVPTHQDLHADIVVKKDVDLWLPPPMISVNYVVHDIDRQNGPMRIIPRTQLHRGAVPQNQPSHWENSCLCPLAAGTAIVRDLRVLHSGTANLMETIRFLPSVEYVSWGFRSTNRADCFPPKRCLPWKLYYRLSPNVQELCKEIVDWDDFEASW